jgi:hypothetical protein
VHEDREGSSRPDKPYLTPVSYLAYPKLAIQANSARKFSQTKELASLKSISGPIWPVFICEPNWPPASSALDRIPGLPTPMNQRLSRAERRVDLIFHPYGTRDRRPCSACFSASPKSIVWTAQAKAAIRGIERLSPGEGNTKQLQGIEPSLVRLRAQDHRVFFRHHG